MRAGIISSLMLTCLALPAQARDAATDEATLSAKSHFAAGRAAVQRHQYDEAMREFDAGYRLKPSPLFLYNIGQVARQAGQPARALDAFAAYLRAAPAAPDRAEVQRWVVALRETVERERERTAAPPPRANEAPPATAAATTTTAPSSNVSLALSRAASAPPPATTAPASGAAATTLTSAPPAPERRTRRTLWIALGTVGGALVLGGVATAIALGARNNSGTPAGFHDLGNLSLGSH